MAERRDRSSQSRRGASPRSNSSGGGFDQDAARRLFEGTIVARLQEAIGPAVDHLLESECRDEVTEFTDRWDRSRWLVPALASVPTEDPDLSKDRDLLIEVLARCAARDIEDRIRRLLNERDARAPTRAREGETSPAAHTYRELLEVVERDLDSIDRQIEAPECPEDSADAASALSERRAFEGRREGIALARDELRHLLEFQNRVQHGRPPKMPALAELAQAIDELSSGKRGLVEGFIPPIACELFGYAISSEQARGFVARMRATRNRGRRSVTKPRLIGNPQASFFIEHKQEDGQRQRVDLDTKDREVALQRFSDWRKERGIDKQD